MIDFPIPKKYTMQLDNIDKKLCSGYVARLGIDGAIESQFKRLDCSRVKDGLILMKYLNLHLYFILIFLKMKKINLKLILID